MFCQSNERNNINFTRDKKLGTQKTCEKCGHKWYIGRTSEDPDTCYECLLDAAREESLSERGDPYDDGCCYCGPGCDGCAGVDQYDFYESDNERGGTQKTCEECGHQWYIGRTSDDPDTCYECLLYAAYEERLSDIEDSYDEGCQNCGRGIACDG